MKLISDELLHEANTLLRANGEIYELARAYGVEYAGLHLNEKVEPDVDNAARPPYWKRAKSEVRILLCTDDPKYADVRARMMKAQDAGERYGIPAITGVMVQYVGLEAGLLTPFISLIFASAGQVSIKAWCAGEASGTSSNQKLS